MVANVNTLRPRDPTDHPVEALGLKGETIVVARLQAAKLAIRFLEDPVGLHRHTLQLRVLLLPQNEAVVPLVRGRVLDEEATWSLVTLEIGERLGLPSSAPFQRSVCVRFHDVLPLEEAIELVALPFDFGVPFTAGTAQVFASSLQGIV